MIILSAADAAKLSDTGITGTLEVWARNNVTELQRIEAKIVKATKQGLRYIYFDGPVDREFKVYFEQAGYSIIPDSYIGQYAIRW